MFDEEDVRARARALVNESVSDDSGESSLQQRVRGSGNIAVQGSNNSVTVTSASGESYAAYTTAQLVREEHVLDGDLGELESRRETASLLKIGFALSPPVLGLLTLKYLPADLMMAGWFVAMGTGIAGWLWGARRELRLSRACRVVARKLEAVQAHLLHRNNWHPSGTRAGQG